jgi:hypothetical protein
MVYSIMHIPNAASARLNPK